MGAYAGNGPAKREPCPAASACRRAERLGCSGGMRTSSASGGSTSRFSPSGMSVSLKLGHPARVIFAGSRAIMNCAASCPAHAHQTPLAVTFHTSTAPNPRNRWLGQLYAPPGSRAPVSPCTGRLSMHTPHF